MKKVLTILLLACFCLTLIPNVSMASDDLTEALGEVSIYNGGEELRYLTVSGAVRPMSYVYFNYVNRLGETKEIPAYCVNPNDDGVTQVVNVGESVKYLANDRASDPKVMGIVACGYPTRGLDELGLESIEEAYYATKTALWCYLLGSWDINKTAVNPNLSGADKEAAERVLAAARDIYTRGTWWDKIYSPKLTVEVDKEYAYPVTINGEEYLQQEITVTSETWVEYYIQVSFADESKVPEGTKLVDMNNNETDKVNVESTGNGYSGKIKILYPKDSINEGEGTAQLDFKCNVYQYAVYYAVCAEVDKYGNIQNYICDTDPTTPMNVSFMSKYKETSDPDIPDGELPQTGLEIIKLEKGTNTPLSGAIFEVKGPNGDVLGSFSTNTEGKIILPLTLSGTYTVTEKTAPDNYLLSRENSKTVTVSYNKVSTVTFENEPYGGLRIEKIDGASGDSLEGAKVEIEHIVSGTVYSGTTQTGGSIDLTDLPIGAYRIKEITAPEGYKLDTNTYTATVNSGEVTTVTLKNYCNPALKIIKYDAKTMERLPDTTFEVYRDVSLIGTYTTDQLGEIVLHDLVEGTYLVKEIATDNSHIVNSTPQEIEIKAGEKIYELIFFNEVKPGINLIKVDKDTMKPLANAKFEISLVGGTFTKEYVTNENGEISLNDLDEGAYVVKEITAPEGYLIDEEMRIIQINGNENAHFVFTNTQKPTLKLVKVDADGNPLAGASFRIAKIEDGSHYLDRITDENGEILIDNLDEGVYSIKEMKAPAGYIADEKEYHVELFAGKTSQIVITNDEKPDLEILKIDGNSGERLAGASFVVKKADGETITNVTTDNSGRALVEDLEVGVYEITETKAPEGYLLNDNPQLITLKPNKLGTVIFENYQKPELTIKKVDAITKDPLKNAEFKIYYASDDTASGELNFIGTYYTDEKGEVHLNNLKSGWYKIAETKAPDGYEQDLNEQTVYIERGTEKTLTFENTPLSGLVIKKVDMDNGEVLAGAKFQVKYLSGISGSGGTVIGEYVTSANGTIVLNRLKAGTYVIEEVKAPMGYEITEGAKTVYLSGEEQTVITVEISDKKIGEGQIIKVDAETGKRLKGAEFEVRRMNGEILGTFTTDDKGVIYLPELADGWYQAIEIKAPKGYFLDSTPHNFEVKEGQTASITIKNSKSSSVLIHKIDSDTKEGIYGVKFLVGDSSHNPIGTYETDQNGYVYIDHELADGKYYIREIEAAEGYQLDTKERTFYLRYGSTEEIIWENTAEKGQIQIVKKSADVNPTNGLPANTVLPNAIFTITNSKGKVVDTIKTDSRGIAVSKLLPLGYYTIEEIQAPNYYAKSDEVITAHIEFSSQVVKFEVLNKSLYTNVAVDKKGYLEAMAGQSIRYDFPVIKNNSNVSLANFYWRDTLPTDAVRLEKISTGTWNQALNYKILYKTNLRDYRLLKDNLLTTQNYILDCSANALSLASGEYITEFMFSFGMVQGGFANMESPSITCVVKTTLPHDYQFTNKTDVGGLYNNWIMANDWWTTKVYNKLNPPTLPKTGY